MDPNTNYHSGLENNDNEGVLYIPQSSRLESKKTVGYLFATRAI